MYRVGVANHVVVKLNNVNIKLPKKKGKGCHRRQ